MNYQKEDFSQCRYNPFTEDLLHAYPELQGIFPDLNETQEKVLRYAMACYDPKSPLIQDFPLWIKRKDMAAFIAGYDFDTEREYLAGLFSGMDEEAMSIIHIFLRMCIRSRLWAMIVSNEDTFWEYNMRLKIPIAKAEKDKDMMSAIQAKTKLSEDQEMFHQRIERLWKEFFGDDEEMAKAAEANFKMNPQQIAKKLKENN